MIGHAVLMGGRYSVSLDDGVDDGRARVMGRVMGVMMGGASLDVFR